MDRHNVLYEAELREHLEQKLAWKMLGLPLKQSSPTHKLTISSDLICFGGVRIRVQDIQGIRYGIFQVYHSGVRGEESYAIDLTDGRESINIECARRAGKGRLWKKDRAKVQDHYQNIVGILFELVQLPLLREMVKKFDGGLDVYVSNLALNEIGISEDKKARILRWEDYWGYIIDGGYIHIFPRNGTKRAFRHFYRLSMRDDWNAVCLKYLLDYIKKQYGFGV